MNIHKEIRKIISFKKNIYLVCLILALSYIAYNKLYRKEGLENSCDSIFGKKEDRTVIKDIINPNPMVFDLNNIQSKKVWVDLQSIKINGSKNLAIVDANQYDVVKKQLETCQDVNIQNGKLRESVNDLKNRGFFARLFNW
jgi:hypothetical protein